MYLVLENQSLKVTIHYKPIREETPEMFITENIKRRDIPSVIQELGLPKSIYTLLINQPYLEIGNETYASNSGLLERHRCESSARVLTLELDTPISEQIRNEMDGFVKIIVASDYEHVSKRLKDLDKPVECHLLYASEHTSTLFTITKPSLIDNLCRYVDFLTFKYEGIMFLEHDYIARTPDFLTPELELFFQELNQIDSTRAVPRLLAMHHMLVEHKPLQKTIETDYGKIEVFSKEGLYPEDSELLETLGNVIIESKEQ